MARICSNGFEHFWQSPQPEAVTVSYRTPHPGRVGGHCFSLHGTVAGQNTGSNLEWLSYFLNNPGLSTDSYVEHYERFYIRCREYPGAGGLRFWSSVPGVHTPGGGTSEGSDDAALATLNDDGTISLWTKGNGAKTLLCKTTGPLVLDQWYRVTMFLRYNQSGSAPTDEIISLALDDAALPFAGGDGVSGNPFNDVDRCLSYDSGNGSGLAYSGNQAAVGTRFGLKTPGQADQDGGILDIDDFVADTELPGSGYITQLRVVSNGSDNGWSDPADWRLVRHLPALTTNSPSPGRIANTIAGAEISFRLETLRSRGGTGAVKAYVASAGFQAGRGNYRVYLTRNGVKTYGSQAAAGAYQWRGTDDVLESITYTGGYGLYLTPATLGSDGSPDDVLEVGVKDGTNAPSFATEMFAITLMVDHESPDPPVAVTPTESIQTYIGSFVGNGTIQDVATPFRPTGLIIKPDGSQGSWWFDGWGEAGEYGNTITGAQTHRHGIALVDDNGFTVIYDATAALNANGVTNRFLAFRDPTGRMIQSGWVTPNPLNYSSAYQDDFDYTIDPDFAIEALLLSSLTADFSVPKSNFFRGPAHVGDIASVMDSQNADQADTIQAVGTGTFQLGHAVHLASPRKLGWVALRTTQVFNGDRVLCEIGSYVGDGAATRDIYFTNELANAGLVIIIPTNTDHKTYRWGSGDADPTSSFLWVSGALRTTANNSALIAFDRRRMTVTTGSGAQNCNRSGTTYHYLAFAGAIDPPEVEMENDVGLTWVEMTDSANTIHKWSKVALPDPDTYYHGYKEPRVLDWGTIRRALSDYVGQYEGTDFSFVLDDTDRAIRAMLANASTRYLPNRPVVARTISDAKRRQFKTPRTIVRGIVRDYKPSSGLTFNMTVQDVLAAKFSLQNDQNQIPQRVITTDDFPQAASQWIEPVPEGEEAPETPVTHDVAAEGLPVPIIYGTISDQYFLDIPTPTGPDMSTQDLTLPAPGGIGVQSIAPAPGGTQRWPVAFKWAAMRAGRIGVVSIAQAEGDNRPRWFRPVWNTVAGADGYIVWMFSAAAGDMSAINWDPVSNPNVPGAEIRYKVFPANQPGYQIYDHMAVFAGLGDGEVWGATTLVSTDMGLGQYPLIYVGDRYLANTWWRQLLVAGHACKTIHGVYLDDEPVNLSTVAATGGDLLVPGYSGWATYIGPLSYEVINGHRYTIIYAKGTYGERARSGDANGLTINVSGIEETGDGTGTLITDLHAQYLHAVKNWILGSYENGAWLSGPTFPDDPTMPIVDEASFATVTALAHARLPSGYRGDFALGVNGERISVRDLVARFNVCGDCNSGFNRKAQFFVSMLDDSTATVAAALSLSDVADIHKDTFEVADDLGHQYNAVPYVHTKDYVGRTQFGWLSSEAPLIVSDSQSITGYGATMSSPTMELALLRGLLQPYPLNQHGADTVTDVVRRFLMRHKDPPRVVTFQIGSVGADVDLGDVIRVSHYAGIAQTGWINRPMRIYRHEFNPGQYTTDLQCLDMQEMFYSGFILGDETALPAAWTSATEAQKVYGFLADETTATFSNGEPAKRLR